MPASLTYVRRPPICLGLVLAAALFISACAGAHANRTLSVSATSTPAPSSVEARAMYHFLASSREEAVGDIAAASREMELALTQDPHSVYLQVQAASLALRRGDRDRARALLTEILQDQPEHPEALVLMGRVNYADGKPEEAAQNFRTALAQNGPDNHDLYVFLGLMYSEGGDNRAALDIVREGLKHYPRSAQLHYYAGHFYNAASLYGAAEKHLKRCLQLAPYFRPAKVELARAYGAEGRTREATALYEQLVRARPTDTEARGTLMLLLASQKRFGEVEETVREADTLGVSTPSLQEGLARLYIAQGKIPQAITELELSVGQFPDQAQSRFLLAMLYLQTRQADKALATFDAIPSDSPLYADAQLRRAMALRSEGRRTEAIEALALVRTVLPDRTEAPVMLAAMYREDGRPAAATRVLAETLAAHPDNEDVRASLAMSYYAQGKVDKSITMMRELLETNPDNVTALNFIGYTYAERGERLDEARTMIEKALEQRPDDGAIIDSLGWVLYQQGEYDEAVKQLERAATLTTDDPVVFEHLGDAYIAVGKDEAAIAQFRRALQLDPSRKIQRRLKRKLTALGAD